MQPLSRQQIIQHYKKNTMKIIISKENKVHFLLQDNAEVEVSANGTNIKEINVVKVQSPKEDGSMETIEKSFENKSFIGQLNTSNCSVVNNVVAPEGRFIGGKFEYVKGNFSVVKGWQDPE